MTELRHTQWKKTICPYDCPTSCGLLAETDGRHILNIKGDPEHPAAKGLICRKMHRYMDSIHSPDRILTPLKRTGEKGEGKFMPITWEAAVDEITGRWKEILKEEGGNGILPFYYSGVMSVVQRKCGDAFFNRMGACSLVKTLCSSAKGAGYEAVMGHTGCLDPRELCDSDLLIVWGSNMMATRLQAMPALKAARGGGKRVVLIEACGEDMAPYCDQIVLIRPGTDGALALAMMHVLVEEGLEDREFLEEYGEGFPEFKDTLKDYTPKWAEEITGIPSLVIRSLALEYGRASRPAIILGSGPSRYGNGGMTVRLITILSVFTGAWGKPGGGLCGCSPTAGPYVDDALVTRPDFRKTPGRKVNLNLLGNALNGDRNNVPVKSLYVYGSNPVGSVCGQTQVIKGLRRPDLFTVVHERFMTDTARYADIILPAAFSVEQSDCYLAYGYCTFGTAYKLTEPAGQCKSNWNTFSILAQAMGYEEEYFKRSEEEMVEKLLEEPGPGLGHVSGGEWEILRKGGVISTPFADHRLFRTASGKIMIVNPKQPNPMPCYLPAHAGVYPLRLIAVPSQYTLNSIFLDREELTAGRGSMKLMIHPVDADSRGIRDGDPVIAFNELAEVEFTARVTELVAPGTAAAAGIYSMASRGAGLLVNALHHQRLSDIGEATTLNDNRIDIRSAVNV